MAGYLLVEQKSLIPPLPRGKGIPANPQRIGFLDFLRDLEKEEFPYHENSKLMVVGIEEVLLASRPDMETTAKQIRKKLSSSANPLSSCDCADIQIVFKQPLQPGHKLTVKHVTQEIPIYLIFGSPIPDEIKGQTAYKASFNLSSNK